MQQDHFFGKVAVKAILVKDGKVLITRDSQDENLWEIPGGRLDADEPSPEDALIREVQEELGVSIRVRRMVHSQQFIHGQEGSAHLLLAYEAELCDTDAEFRPDPGEVAEMRWISKDELPKYEIYPNCHNALKVYCGLTKRGYPAKRDG